MATRLVAVKGMGVSCPNCGAHIFYPHKISMSVVLGLSAFLFVPLLILLFGIGRLWWVVALGMIALLILTYVLEVLFGSVETYDHSGQIAKSKRRSRNFLILLVSMLVIGIMASLVDA